MMTIFTNFIYLDLNALTSSSISVLSYLLCTWPSLVRLCLNVQEVVRATPSMWLEQNSEVRAEGNSPILYNISILLMTLGATYILICISTSCFHSVGSGVSINSDIVFPVIPVSGIVNKKKHSFTKYQSYKIKISDISISLIPSLIDQFWNDVMSNLSDNIVVYVLVKVDFSGTIRSFSYKVAVTRDIKFKDVLYKSI